MIDSCLLTSHGCIHLFTILHLQQIPPQINLTSMMLQEVNPQDQRIINISFHYIPVILSSSQLETNMLPYNTFCHGALLCVPEHHNIIMTPTLKSKLFPQLRIHDAYLGSCVYHPCCFSLLKCRWNHHADSCRLLPGELSNPRDKWHNFPFTYFTHDCSLPFFLWWTWLFIPV